MSIRINYKLSGKEAQAVLEFCRQLDLPLQTVARQALFMTMQAAYTKAAEIEKLAQAEKEVPSEPEYPEYEIDRSALNTEGGDIAGDTGSGIQAESSVDPITLADTNIGEHPVASS